MGIVPPTEEDLSTILRELDDDFDGQVSRDEFFNLIMMVLGKMIQSEEELQLRSNKELKMEHELKHKKDHKEEN